MRNQVENPRGRHQHNPTTNQQHSRRRSQAVNQVLGLLVNQRRDPAVSPPGAQRLNQVDVRRCNQPLDPRANRAASRRNSL